jgi:sugar lactone lactonase YvrE
MSKATTAIVSLLAVVVACVCVCARRLIVLLAAGGVRRQFLRYAALALLALLVLLGCGPSWASFSLTFQGLVQTLNTGGSITLISPSGIVVDAVGDVYIVDTGNSRIVEVDAQGMASVVTISGLGPALSSPNGIAIDGSGKLYVADTGNNRVVEITAVGAGSAISTGGVTLSSPKGIALDQSGDLFIADTTNNRIVEVASGGSAAVLTITVSSGSSTLNTPIGLAVGVTGKLYIADSGNSRIVTVAAGSTTGVVASILGGVTLSAPKAVTVDRMGNVFIADTGNSRIAGPEPDPHRSFVCLGRCPGGGVVSECRKRDQHRRRDPRLSVSSGAGRSGEHVCRRRWRNVIRIPAGGGAATVVALGSPGGLSIDEIDGVAVDGAGNLFISDHTNNRILVVTPAGVVSILSITGLSPVLGLPVALAFDGAGNLYIADYANGRIIRVSTLVVAGSTASGLGVVIGTGAFTFAEETLTGMTVDAQGNIYAAARTDNSSSIIKVTAAGVAAELSLPGITPALSNPQGVAADAMGNVYVLDGDSPSSRIVRLTTAGVASVLGISGLPAPSTLGSEGYGVTLDPSGNLYIPDISNNRVVFVNVSASVLAFPSTDVGATSSPKTATVTNIGDLPLIFATVPTYTVNFSEDTGDESLCALSTSLAAGILCDVSVEFTPQSAGSLSVGIVVTNNSLNLTATTQNVAVSGTGVSVADTTAVAVSTNPTAANIGQPLGVTAIVTDTTAGHTATIPTGGVTFMDTVGSTTVSLNGGSAVALNGAGTAILAGVTLAGASTHTITANYVGVSGTFAASSNTTTLTVSKDTATVAGPATQPVQVANGQAGSVPVIVTGPYSVVAVPSGSLTYSILNSLSVSVASGTAPLTAGSTNSTATVPLASSLPAGSYTVSVTYGGDTNYAASAAATTVAVVVGLITPTIDWTQPAPITYGATLSSVLSASAVNGSTVVPGSFAYKATPQGGSAGGVNGTTVLGAGSYMLTATFTPTDTSTYASASATVALTVAKAAPAVALAASGNPVVLATAITFTATVSTSSGTPSGSVSFYDGSTLLGSGTLALGVAAYATSSLAVGAHSITAVYSGSSNFSAQTSSVLTETVTAPTAIVTTTTLTASPNPLADGQPATLTATVTPAPTGSPAGTISFYSGSTLLGTGTLNASGVATFTTSSLVVGADSITAVYPGNAGFAASTSSAVSETVTTAYTVTAPTTPVPVEPGGAATIDITVPPLGGAFDSLVTLSATGLPPGATATFNPPTVTPGSAGAPTVLTIQLATLTASNLPRGISPNRAGLLVLPFSLGFVLFGAVLARGRIPGRIPKTLGLAVALAVFGVATLLTGCGGGFANTPSTPAGNYTVTVTGTSGAFHASTTVTLVVQ